MTENPKTNPFKVGDRIRSISSDNPLDRPYGSEWTVLKVYNNDVYYRDGYAAHYSKFELVQSAKPEIKYPYFVQHFTSYEIIKFTDITTGITLHKGRGLHEAGYTSTNFLPCTDKRFEPCDFTIEPNIFDIDWWDHRFNAGLPVWYVPDVEPIQVTRLPSTYVSVYKFFTQPMRYIAFGSYYIPYNETSSCQDTVEANQSTTKEQPMDKTTLKLLLELLTGASEEVKDATNSKFVGIITKNDEYVGYIYCNTKDEATKVMQQPKMELHQLHLFEKAGVLAQKPREVTFDSVVEKTVKAAKPSKE